MKSSSLVTISVVVAVLVMWMVLFSTSNKRPEKISGLVGCYLTSEAGGQQKITITQSGLIKYRNQETLVIPYEDKQSMSLLPTRKVALGSDGKVQFTDGHPFLLRIDSDNKGFTVLGDNGEYLVFRRHPC